MDVLKYIGIGILGLAALVIILYIGLRLLSGVLFLCCGFLQLSLWLLPASLGAVIGVPIWILVSTTFGNIVVAVGLILCVPWLVLYHSTRTKHWFAALRRIQESLGSFTDFFGEGAFYT